MIAAILGGETQVFHDLIRPHERSVYLMALSYMKNEADAEDVAQEAFVRAFRNLASFRAESKFSTWLISITLNEARTRLRRKMLVPMDSLDTPRTKISMFLRLCCAIGAKYPLRRSRGEKSGSSFKMLLPVFLISTVRSSCFGT